MLFAHFCTIVTPEGVSFCVDLKNIYRQCDHNLDRPSSTTRPVFATGRHGIEYTASTPSASPVPVHQSAPQYLIVRHPKYSGYGAPQYLTVGHTENTGCFPVSYSMPVPKFCTGAAPTTFIRLCIQYTASTSSNPPVPFNSTSEYAPPSTSQHVMLQYRVRPSTSQFDSPKKKAMPQYYSSIQRYYSPKTLDTSQSLAEYVMHKVHTPCYST